MMRKQLIIVGIAVLFIAVGLSGCINKENSDHVTIQGLLLSSRLAGDEYMFLIVEGGTYDSLVDFWSNGSSEFYEGNHYVLTRNGELILDMDAYETTDAEFDGFGVYDEVRITGIVGSTIVENPDGEITKQHSINIVKIEMVNEFEG